MAKKNGQVPPPPQKTHHLREGQQVVPKSKALPKMAQNAPLPKAPPTK